LHGEPVEGNRLFQKHAAKHGDRIRGYVGFNPYYEKALTERLDEFFSQPFFVGIKFLCFYWQVPVTDARFRPALEYAQRRRLPILLHTWDDPYDSPAMLNDIVREYPDAAFLLGHSGGGNAGRLEAHELAAANANVYLEWCGSFCSSIPWETTLKVVDPSRVIFGTDAMGHDMAWELARFLSLDVPQETLLPILGDNMRRILARATVPGADAFRKPPS
jgi:predicted TIM-barrel fold metal-dependent hydrolase